MLELSFIKPMLAKRVERLPEEPEWEYELKLEFLGQSARVRSAANSKAGILSVICIVWLIVFALAKLTLSSSGPVDLSVENYSHALANVKVRNRSSSQLDYVLKVERKTLKGWPKYTGGIPVGEDRCEESGSLYPGQVKTMSVPVMVYAPACPFRVSIFCWNPDHSAKTGFQSGSLRFKAGLWLKQLHMPRLAQMMWGGFKVLEVSGPEMEQ
jgi:hypothetical protein